MALFGPSITKLDPNNTQANAQFNADLAKAQASNQGYDSANVGVAAATPQTSPTTPTVVPPPPETPKTSPQGDSSGGEDHCQCPFCSGSTLVNKIGKTLSHISGFLQRSFSIKIPTGVLQYIQDKAPVSKTAALKGPCKSCGGKGTIPDPSKKANAAAAQAAANHKKNAEEITKNENKLAPHGGNRYTIIQGSDLLEVGLGMNDVPSYVVLKDAGRRNKKLVSHSDLSSKGAPMFFEGAPCNYIQGTNPPASPGGHYFIKCSNKFSVLAGAQGIDITTGGPLVISGGQTRISGPEISITTQTGPLSLEGEVVNITGKSVEVATSDGDFCVRGNISSSANVRVAGATHSEHLSFVTADCVGYNSWTDNSSSAEFQTGPANYGSINGKGQIQAALDLYSHVLSKTTDVMNIKNLAGPAAIQELVEKNLNIAYQAKPYELTPTGYILPGTIIQFTSLSGPSNTAGPVSGPGIGVVGAPVLLNSFPHTHTLPSQPHCHSIRLPAIDFSADTSEQLRAKQAGIVDLPAPGHKSTGAAKAIEDGLQSLASNVFSGTWAKLTDTLQRISWE